MTPPPFHNGERIDELKEGERTDTLEQVLNAQELEDRIVFDAVMENKWLAEFFPGMEDFLKTL